MTYFNVMSIQYGGNIEGTLELGMHAQTVTVTPMEIQPNNKEKTEAILKIKAHYTYDVNGKRAIDFHVVSTYLILGINKANIDKDIIRYRIFLGKTFGHLQGVLATKIQDNKWIQRIPDEPDFSLGISMLSTLVSNLHK